MKKFYKLTLALVVILISFTSSNTNSIPTPGAEEPAYDDEGNPTYIIKYGKGDRMDQATGKPLNLIQITCKGEGVDQAPDLNMEECREDDSLVEFKYGWMDFNTYKGWRAYHAECHVCHGPDAMGSTYAPSLMESVKNGLTFDDFFKIIAFNPWFYMTGSQKSFISDTSYAAPSLMSFQVVSILTLPNSRTHKLVFFGDINVCSIFNFTFFTFINCHIQLMTN